MVKCGSCDETFKRNEKSMACSACKNKYHQPCSNVTEEEFAMMLVARTKLKWFCQLCEADVSDILTNFEKFKKVSKEISNIKNDISNKLKDIEQRLAHCEVQKSSSDVSHTIQEQVAKDYTLSREEERLIESKKCNLVFFNVPECTAESPGDRMKEDYKALNDAYDKSRGKNINCS